MCTLSNENMIMHICSHYLQKVHFVDTYRKSCNIFCNINKDLEEINSIQYRFIHLIKSTTKVKPENKEFLHNVYIDVRVI